MCDTSSVHVCRFLGLSEGQGTPASWPLLPVDASQNLSSNCKAAKQQFRLAHASSQAAAHSIKFDPLFCLYCLQACITCLQAKLSAAQASAQGGPDLGEVGQLLGMFPEHQPHANH